MNQVRNAECGVRNEQPAEDAVITAIEKDLVSMSAAIGEIHESNCHYSHGLARVMSEAGLSVQDMTVRELCELHEKFNVAFNKAYEKTQNLYEAGKVAAVAGLSAKVRVFARIKKSSEFANQDTGKPFPIELNTLGWALRDGYVWRGGPGGQYRLWDLELYVLNPGGLFVKLQK